MMSMSGATVLGESGDEHIRLELPDDPDHITQYLLFIPGTERLCRRLGEAEIKGPGKELLGPIDPACCQHLLRTYQPQLHALLVTDKILTAIAPGHGQIARP